jgi:transcriptional regulator with XRE-family HTH domain
MAATESKFPYVSSGIIHLLLKQGMNLTAIAKLLNVSKSFVSRLKSGKRSLTLEHLRILERELGEPLPWLLIKATPLSSVPSELRPLYRATFKLLKPKSRARRPRSAA